MVEKYYEYFLFPDDYLAEVAKVRIQLLERELPLKPGTLLIRI
jgi:hypothetical protein